MKLKVLYFAGLRQTLGVSEEVLTVPETLVNVDALRTFLINQGKEILRETRNLRYAVNHELANLETTIQDGDEVAFFPPVTGG